MAEAASEGHALRSFRQLSETIKALFWDTASALGERFEPKHRQELYLIKFQSRTNLHGKDWADFTKELWNLADKAYSDFSEEAWERLSLERFLD